MIRRICDIALDTTDIPEEKLRDIVVSSTPIIDTTNIKLRYRERGYRYDNIMILLLENYVVLLFETMRL